VYIVRDVFAMSRRRAEEIERLTIENYNTEQAINENVDSCNFNNSQETEKNIAKTFLPLTIRGKLNRKVGVLLSHFDRYCIDMILKYRIEAGVKLTNNYIFSVPNSNPLGKQYIRACPLLKKFAESCGANVPRSLRVTALRKHSKLHIYAKC